ncbi:MAG: hypothetical protein G3M70_07130 [Candidatus Nitronauta litoralis]|uniref:Host-nuclease inhibitor protein Gam n=1 Tax=Candidatus Nitronauta litoralis TaxID=2705533 RepID=A0A7T0FZT2_9BACT|nr:MAG: hypothetical protein G3M70_07130 [Candidatus Nitronauta litoralis]
MSKSKKKPVIIKDIAQAEEAVKRLHQIGLKREYWSQMEARDIQKVKDKWDARRAEGDEPALIKEQKELEAALETYAGASRAKWDAKSLKLRYGTLSFHAGQPAVKTIRSIAKNFEVALARLIALPWSKPYIRTVQEINKDAILDSRKVWEKKPGGMPLYDSQLKEAGLKVVQEEKFRVTTTAEKEIRERLEARKQ